MRTFLKELIFNSKLVAEYARQLISTGSTNLLMSGNVDVTAKVIIANKVSSYFSQGVIYPR